MDEKEQTLEDLLGYLYSAEPLDPKNREALLRALESEQPPFKRRNQILKTLEKKIAQQLANTGKIFSYVPRKLSPRVRYFISVFNSRLFEPQKTLLALLRTDNQWSLYLQAVKRLKANQPIESSTNSRNQTHTLELAKHLSVNDLFNNLVAGLRVNWEINIGWPFDTNSDMFLTVDDLIIACAFSAKPTEREWSKLRNDLEDLCRKCDLRWPEDYPLVVIAVCCGLSPDVLGNWEHVEPILERSNGMHDNLIVTKGTDALIASMGITIAYLGSLLAETGYEQKDVPNSIKSWISFATSICNEIPLSPRAAPEILELMHGLPDDIPRAEPQLYLRISPETTKEDIDRIYPELERAKRALYGKPRRQFRIWKNFERDMELYKLYLELDNYAEAIREYDRRNPHNRLRNDGDVPKIRNDILDLARQIVKRCRDHQRARHLR
jgi:hypothetical protein